MPVPTSGSTVPLSVPLPVSCFSVPVVPFFFSSLHPSCLALTPYHRPRPPTDRSASRAFSPSLCTTQSGTTQTRPTLSSCAGRCVRAPVLRPRPPPRAPIAISALTLAHVQERFLVPDTSISTVDGASFAGFYYIRYQRSTGSITGFYYHRTSEWCVLRASGTRRPPRTQHRRPPPATPSFRHRFQTLDLTLVPAQGVGSLTLL